MSQPVTAAPEPVPPSTGPVSDDDYLNWFEYFQKLADRTPPKPWPKALQQQVAAAAAAQTAESFAGSPIAAGGTNASLDLPQQSAPDGSPSISDMVGWARPAATIDGGAASILASPKATDAYFAPKASTWEPTGFERAQWNLWAAQQTAPPGSSQGGAETNVPEDLGAFQPLNAEARIRQAMDLWNYQRMAPPAAAAGATPASTQPAWLSSYLASKYAGEHPFDQLETTSSAPSDDDAPEFFDDPLLSQSSVAQFNAMYGEEAPQIFSASDLIKGFREDKIGFGKKFNEAIDLGDAVTFTLGDGSAVPLGNFMDGLPYSTNGDPIDLGYLFAINQHAEAARITPGETSIALKRMQQPDPSSWLSKLLGPLIVAKTVGVGGSAMAASIGGARPGPKSTAATDPFVDFKTATDVAPGYYTTNPRNVRYGQPTHNPVFKDGRSVVQTTRDLSLGRVSPDQIGDPIRLVKLNGKFFSLDNRRLVAFKTSGVGRIRVQVVDANDPIIAGMISEADRINPINGEGWRIHAVKPKDRPAAIKWMVKQRMIEDQEDE